MAAAVESVACSAPPQHEQQWADSVAPGCSSRWPIKRHLAIFWAIKITVVIFFFLALTGNIVPYHLSGMKMFWPEKSDTGLSAWEFGRLMAMAAVMCLGMTAVQDVAWNFIHPERRGEKVRGGGAVGEGRGWKPRPRVRRAGARMAGASPSRQSSSPVRSSAESRLPLAPRPPSPGLL
jgi:hypothetical protein